jgi:hypothetical protein
MSTLCRKRRNQPALLLAAAPQHRSAAMCNLSAFRCRETFQSPRTVPVQSPTSGTRHEGKSPFPPYHLRKKHGKLGRFIACEYRSNVFQDAQGKPGQPSTALHWTSMKRTLVYTSAGRFDALAGRASYRANAFRPGRRKVRARAQVILEDSTLCTSNAHECQRNHNREAQRSHHPCVLEQAVSLPARVDR